MSHSYWPKSTDQTGNACFRATPITLKSSNTSGAQDDRSAAAIQVQNAMAESSKEHPAVPPAVSSGTSILGKPASDASSSLAQNSKSWDPDSFAAPRLTDEAISAEPAEMDGPVATATKGARTPAELLRRMSLVGQSSGEALDFDPREQYPSLELSGTVISATFCIPYSVSFAACGDWVLQPRRGTSALFDSFNYLSSSKSAWKHRLVGWTGEIHPLPQPPPEPKRSGSTGQAGLTRPKSSGSWRSISQPGSQAAEAIPPSCKPRNPGTPSAEGVVLTPQDRHRLESLLRKHKGGAVMPVWLSDEAEEMDADLHLKDQSRWRRYGEHELYTLFHYKQHAPDNGRAERRWWADYVRMNQLFADRILEIYQAGDVVWIHDYHLMLLPHMLRQRIPNIYIGFFLHIPFPSSEFLRCLPRRKDILEGCLGSTMIAFQSYSYSRHFSSCCERVLGFESSSAGWMPTGPTWPWMCFPSASM